MWDCAMLHQRRCVKTTTVAAACLVYCHGMHWRDWIPDQQGVGCLANRSRIDTTTIIVVCLPVAVVCGRFLDRCLVQDVRTLPDILSTVCFVLRVGDGASAICLERGFTGAKWTQTVLRTA